MKRFCETILAACMLLSLCGCGSGPSSAAGSSAAPPETSAPAASLQEAAPPAETGPTGVNPLTGLPMEEEWERLRPVAVMLNDLRAAQPQLGVSQADLIYEVPAEGGITRMLAVFQSLDGVGNLGSIRSVRAYYLELALGLDALLVHAGGSPEAYEDIAAWGVDNMDGVNGGSDAGIFWRDAARRKNAGYEHSLLTSGEKVQAYLNAGHFDVEHRAGYTGALSFTEDAVPAGGTAAERVSVKYSQYKTATFTYDAASEKYLVGQFGGDYVDGNTGGQVGVTNVLALETDMHVISGDTYGRLAVDLTGGSGTCFCGGVAQRIRWSKGGRNDPMVFRREDGTALSLGRGNTYICLFDPDTGKLTVS